uniref:Uncharacterized protein n=1 Tax=Cucumis melo TaxID=3656 RepID=A0A9I9DSK2_CUCME
MARIRRVLGWAPYLRRSSNKEEETHPLTKTRRTSDDPNEGAVDGGLVIVGQLKGRHG